MYKEILQLQNKSTFERKLKTQQLRQKYKQELVKFSINNFYSQNNQVKTNKTNYSVWKLNNSLMGRNFSDLLKPKLNENNSNSRFQNLEK